MRDAAAAKEALWQGDRVGCADACRGGEWKDQSHGGFARENPLGADAMVCRVPAQNPPEAALRSENSGRKSGVQRVVNPFVRIGRIIPAVLYEIRGQHSDSHRL